MIYSRFLLANNYITKEEYILGISEQLRKIPSSLEALIDLSVIDSLELIDLIHKSQDNQCDIYELLEDAVKVRVDDYKQKVSTSFAEIILDKGFVKKEELIESLEKYSNLEVSPGVLTNEEDGSVNEKLSENKGVSNDENVISVAALESLRELQGDSFNMDEFNVVSDNIEQEEVSVVSTAEEAIDEANEGIQISSAALDSLKELGGVSQEELNNLEVIANTTVNIKEENDYSLIFTSKKYNKLNKIHKMISDAVESRSDISNYLNSLFREIHVIKGATTLVSASRSRVIIEIWENVIDLLFKLNNDDIIEWSKSNLESLKNSFEILWEIREALQEGRSEEEYLENDMSKSNYLNCIGSLKNIVQELKK